MTSINNNLFCYTNWAYEPDCQYISRLCPRRAHSLNCDCFYPLQNTVIIYVFISGKWPTHKKYWFIPSLNLQSWIKRPFCSTIDLKIYFLFVFVLMKTWKKNPSKVWQSRKIASNFHCCPSDPKREFRTIKNLLMQDWVSRVE